MAKPGYFASRCKGDRLGRRRKIASGARHCRTGPPVGRSPLKKAVGTRVRRRERRHGIGGRDGRRASYPVCPSPARRASPAQQPFGVLGTKLRPHRLPQGTEAEGAQIVMLIDRSGGIGVDLMRETEIVSVSEASRAFTVEVKSGDETRTIETDLVVHGAGRGMKLGFGTANIDAIDTLLPAPGVYVHYKPKRDGSNP